MFPRAYVEELRQENGKYRQRARRPSLRATAAHRACAGHRPLADPTDLPFSEDHLVDPGKLTAALDDLLARKPHLASRRPVGTSAKARHLLSVLQLIWPRLLRERAR